MGHHPPEHNRGHAADRFSFFLRVGNNESGIGIPEQAGKTALIMIMIFDEDVDRNAYAVNRKS